MATTDPTVSRFALRPSHEAGVADGAWWPSSRTLADQLDALFAAWPAERGKVLRVGYSPPDWDDRPRAVSAGGRRVKTGGFPRDDTHEITLAMFGGQRFRIVVIPPDTEPADAAERLSAVSDSA